MLAEQFIDTVKTMHLETNEMIPFSNIQFKYISDCCILQIYS